MKGGILILRNATKNRKEDNQKRREKEREKKIRERERESCTY